MRNTAFCLISCVFLSTNAQAVDPFSSLPDSEKNSSAAPSESLSLSSACTPSANASPQAPFGFDARAPQMFACARTNPHHIVTFNLSSDMFDPDPAGTCYVTAESRNLKISNTQTQHCWSIPRDLEKASLRDFCNHFQNYKDFTLFLERLRTPFPETTDHPVFFTFDENTHPYLIPNSRPINAKLHPEHYDLTKVDLSKLMAQSQKSQGVTISFSKTNKNAFNFSTINQTVTAQAIESAQGEFFKLNVAWSETRDKDPFFEIDHFYVKNPNNQENKISPQDFESGFLSSIIRLKTHEIFLKEVECFKEELRQQQKSAPPSPSFSLSSAPSSTPSSNASPSSTDSKSTPAVSQGSNADGSESLQPKSKNAKRNAKRKERRQRKKAEARAAQEHDEIPELVPVSDDEDYDAPKDRVGSDEDDDLGEALFFLEKSIFIESLKNAPLGELQLQNAQLEEFKQFMRVNLDNFFDNKEELNRTIDGIIPFLQDPEVLDALFQNESIHNKADLYQFVQESIAEQKALFLANEDASAHPNAADTFSLSSTPVSSTSPSSASPSSVPPATPVSQSTSKSCAPLNAASQESNHFARLFLLMSESESDTVIQVDPITNTKGYPEEGFLSKEEDLEPGEISFHEHRMNLSTFDTTECVFHVTPTPKKLSSAHDFLTLFKDSDSKGFALSFAFKDVHKPISPELFPNVYCFIGFSETSLKHNLLEIRDCKPISTKLHDPKIKTVDLSKIKQSVTFESADTVQANAEQAPHFCKIHTTWRHKDAKDPFFEVDNLYIKNRQKTPDNTMDDASKKKFLSGIIKLLVHDIFDSEKYKNQ